MPFGISPGGSAGHLSSSSCCASRPSSRCSSAAAAGAAGAAVTAAASSSSSVAAAAAAQQHFNVNLALKWSTRIIFILRVASLFELLLLRSISYCAVVPRRWAVEGAFFHNEVCLGLTYTLCVYMYLLLFGRHSASSLGYLTQYWFGKSVAGCHDPCRSFSPSFFSMSVWG